MRYFEDKKAGIVIVGLRPGEFVFESIEQLARECDIHTGVVTSGIGSLTRAHIHTVRSVDYPPQEEYFTLEGPLEVVQFGGVIANYQPHLHISLWDEKRQFWGGHVHEGCQVLALSEISILRCPELRMNREKIDDSGVFHLTLA